MTVAWVTFDCYGTLIDWERGITDALLPLIRTPIDRDDLARRYIATEAKVEAESYRSYRDVLDEAGRRVLASLGSDAPSPLTGSLPSWHPFAEVPAALAELRQRGRKIAILSNVDRDLIASSIPQLRIEPDLVVTAQDCGSYKPAFGHWRMFAERSGAGADVTVHVGASQYHDMRPAAELGYRTVFIDRHGETLETQGQGPLSAQRATRVIPDLTALPSVIDELE
ncbi:MAG: HAD family hydrolase [Candidatus Limnocylindria bacterium]